jgi:CheY-like chemotaxis protein
MIPMTGKLDQISILVADDDEDDRLMIREALEESRVFNRLDFVKDGEELIEFLKNASARPETGENQLPGLILLDLNMPIKDGREALGEIKADPGLKKIPIVVMTTSSAEEDIVQTYDLGVNSFITKPVSFDGLVNVIKTLTTYWFSIVRLPSEAGVHCE